MKKILSIILLMSIMLTSLQGITVSAASDTISQFYFENNTNVVSKDNKMIMEVKNGEPSIIATKNSTNIKGDSFDLKWTMALEKISHSTSTAISMFTGSNRFYILFTESGFQYCSTENYDWVPVDYPIGNSTHDYRIVAKNGKAEMYIDGLFISDFHGFAHNGSQMFQFHVGASGGTTKVVVSNFELGDYKAEAAKPNKEDSAQSEKVPAKAFLWEFDDESEIDKWQNLTRNGWRIEDGCLKSDNYADNANASRKDYNVQRQIGYADDFVFEAKMRAKTITSMFAILFNMNKTRIMIYKERDLWLTVAEGNNVYDPAHTHVKQDEWFVMKVETYDDGTRGRFYIDDALVRDFPIRNGVLFPDPLIYIQSTTEGSVVPASEIEIDYIKFEPIFNSIDIAGIKDGDVFLEGDDIEIGANFRREVNAEKIEYIINKTVVAEGLKSNDYKTVISDLPAGSYEMSARSENDNGLPIKFTITKSFIGNIVVNNNDSNGTTLTTEIEDELNQTHGIEYLLDGVPVGSSNKAPYAINIPKLSNEPHTITAVCKGINGNKIGNIVRTEMPDLNGKEVSESYSNEISYSVSGNSGFATYEFNNGNHKLYMKHESDKLVYLTDSGEESYKHGKGNFTIITNGPYANIYRNGQFAFSFVLPKTNDISKKIDNKGLAINSESISVPENRSNYFIKRDIGAGKYTYDVPELPYIYNMDFLAKKTDNARFVVNDGYYRMDISIKDGKIYAWHSLFNRSKSSEKYLCDMPNTDGYIYFRLETSSGMSRLYADGEWIATFRNTRSSGGQNISLDIPQNNSIKSLSLRDCTDLFIFADNFDGSGAFPSKDYIKDSGALYIEKHNGILLNGLENKDARCEWNMYTGETDFSSDVTIEELKGGFWFIADHSTTNAYSKIGYNAKTGCFEGFDYVNGTISNTQTAKGSLPIGKKFNISLKCRQYEDHKIITLYVDGVQVFKYNKKLFMRGTIGFSIIDGLAHVHNVNYRGDTKPMANVYTSVIPNYVTVPTHDILEKDNELVLVASEGARLRSNDNGKTWTSSARVENDNHEILQFRDENGNPSNEAILIRHANTGATDENGYQIRNINLFRSYDYGESWTFERNLNEKPEVTLFSMYGRIQQGLSGRIYVPIAGGFSESEGFVDVYYSDDKGKTWTKSNRVDSNEVGYYVQEPCILEMADGTVRMYSRTNLGIINYFVSYDGGKTFATEAHQTPLLAAANCFNIQRDLYDSKSIYAFWSYDNANLNATEQFPRTRWALARSTDECKTWEFLGTPYEGITPTMNESMNMNLCITKDNLILNCWSDDQFSPVGNLPNRIITIKKESLQSTKDFERVHVTANNAIENTATILKDFRDDMFIIHPESGNVISHGEMYVDMAQSEYVCADVAANYIRARAIYEENGSVTLKMGITDIRFEKSSVVEKNGKRYIPIADFVQKFDLKIFEDKGIIIVANDDKWSDIQMDTARYAVELFSVEP